MHLTVARFTSLLDPEITGLIMKTVLISFAKFSFAIRHIRNIYSVNSNIGGSKVGGGVMVEGGKGKARKQERH